MLSVLFNDIKRAMYYNVTNNALVTLNRQKIEKDSNIILQEYHNNLTNNSQLGQSCLFSCFNEFQQLKSVLQVSSKVEKCSYEDCCIYF